MQLLWMYSSFVQFSYVYQLMFDVTKDKRQIIVKLKMTGKYNSDQVRACNMEMFCFMCLVPLILSQAG